MSQREKQVQKTKILFRREPDVQAIVTNQTLTITQKGNPSVEGARVSRLGDGSKLAGYFDGVKTVYECFQRGVRLSGDEPFLGWKPTAKTPYQWMTYNQAATRINAFGDGLVKLGFAPENDTRIGLYSQNRPEYIVADQGFNRHSMCCVPLYDSLGKEACDFIVNQAELECVVVDTNVKVKVLLDRRETMPDVSTIIIMEPASKENLSKCKKAKVKLLQMDDVERLGKENPIEPHPPKPDNLCMVCYTSGTTGTPKGAMISHKNMCTVIAATNSALKKGSGVDIRNTDVAISYLPLAHSYERMFETTVITVGGKIGFFQGDVKLLMDDIKELQPTLFPSVPRLLNRFYDKVMAGISGSKLKKFLFKKAVASKTKELKRGIVRNTSVWDKLAFKTVQASLGGRVRLITTGSAPISPHVLTFLRSIVGCPVVEGYGQTENTAVATLTFDCEPGHVGPPTTGQMIKLNDVPEMGYFAKQNKGEVCIKGGIVFVGYLKDEEKTAETLDKDGWLHTGDIGEWTPSGTLKVIDRKKNIFKLAQGEYIAPEKIENVLTQSPFLAQVYVHGDSLQADILAVVVPDETTLPALCSKMKISGSFKELCANEDVKEAIMSNLTELALSNGLTKLEQVKDIYIHPELFSVENGLLTPTFKLKRNVAHEIFANHFAEMYAKLNPASTTPNPFSP